MTAYTQFCGTVQWHRLDFAYWVTVSYDPHARAAFLAELQVMASKKGMRLMWLKPRKVVEPTGEEWVYWKAARRIDWMRDEQVSA